MFETSFIFSGASVSRRENLYFASIYYPDLDTDFFRFLDLELIKWYQEKGCDMKYLPQWLRSFSSESLEDELRNVFDSIVDDDLRR